MAQKNSKLHAAKNAKADEFYTQLTDIEKEMRHYKKHFKDKVVFCNCDDPTWSEFWRYFHLNFAELGLKKLISTHYDTKERTYKLEYTGGNDDNVEAGLKTDLLQNGDFRSDECIELLKESDIVVSNPPFSLFRLYVAQLMEYEKKFIIIGNMNAITYKEFFPLLKENKVWAGYGFNLSMVYKTPYPNTLEANRKFVKSKGYDPDEGYVKVPSVCWFTNIDTKKRHEDLILWKNYTPSEYPTYDNYDAINVDKVDHIPIDYCESWGITGDEFNKMQPNEWEVVRQSIEHDGSTTVWIVPAKGTQLRKALREQTDGYRDAIENALTQALYCSGKLGVPITFLDKHNPEQFEIIKFRKGNDEKDLAYVAETATIRCTDRQTDRQTDAELRHTSELSSRRSYKYCNGIIGVPITFLDKYSPKQFRIIWQASGNTRVSAPQWILQQLQYRQHKEDRGGCTIVDGKRTYGRIFINKVL